MEKEKKDCALWKEQQVWERVWKEKIESAIKEYWSNWEK